jgi:hypothetical protein
MLLVNVTRPCTHSILVFREFPENLQKLNDLIAYVIPRGPLLWLGSLPDPFPRPVW